MLLPYVLLMKNNIMTSYLEITKSDDTMIPYFCFNEISYIPFVAVICVFGVGWSISVAMMTTMTTSTPTV